MPLKTSHFHLTFETPLGHAGIVYQENPFSLIRIFLPMTDFAALRVLAEREAPGKEGSHAGARRIVEQINAYFNGRPIEPCWADLSMGTMSELSQSVLAAAADIPYGTVASYKEVAEAVGRPRAYRFVGSTLAKNPFPIMIPCHRVIRSDGSIGRFGGGTDLKQRLIQREQYFYEGRES